MKKLFCIASLILAAGLVCAQVNERGNKNFTGEVNLDGDWKIKGTKVNVTATELNQLDSGAALSVGSLAVSGNAIVTGAVTGQHVTAKDSLTVNTNATIGAKTTCNGELEVNNSDVDINMTLTGNEIDIAQTNTAGTASTPLINVNDDRTGSTANEASEAALYIDSDGAYGLTVADGIVQIEAEIDTASGDILLDPAGSEVHIDGGLHVGGTDNVGDNNAKVDGYLTVSGSITGGTFMSTAGVGLVYTNHTVSGANDLVTPTATMTLTRQAEEAVTNVSITLTRQGEESLTNATLTITRQADLSVTGALFEMSGTLYDSTGAALTNASGVAMNFVTNVILQYAAEKALTNAVLALELAAEKALTNAVLTVNLAAEKALTNATCAITPDLASNSVVAVTLTPATGTYLKP